MIKTVIFVCAIISLAWCDVTLTENNHNKRSVSPGYLYGGSPLLGGQLLAQQIEITKEVPIVKAVAVPVPHPVPVAVPQPVPVHVPEPVPVHVPVAVPVVKHVPVHVEKPVPYPVAKPYPVEIIKKVPYPVPKPYPVPVPVYKVKHVFLQPTHNKWW